MCRQLEETTTRRPQVDAWRHKERAARRSPRVNSWRDNIAPVSRRHSGRRSPHVARRAGVREAAARRRRGTSCETTGCLDRLRHVFRSDPAPAQAGQKQPAPPAPDERRFTASRSALATVPSRAGDEKPRTRSAPPPERLVARDRATRRRCVAGGCRAPIPAGYRRMNEDVLEPITDLRQRESWA